MFMVDRLITQHSNGTDAEASVRYLERFAFDLPDVDHQLGWLDNKRTIMVQSFTPSSPIGTLLFVHGYFDHVGLMRHAIAFFVTHGYQVLAYDLPGHGLSAGQRHSIGDFNEYIDAFHRVTIWAGGLSTQLSLVAHSTGAAITLTYLSKYPNPFAHLIWASPLVRPAAWGAIQFFAPLLGIFMKRIFRLSAPSSSDSDYLKWIKQDPFRGHYVPLDWIHALKRWNATIQDIDTLNVPVLLLQGDRDRTVDWHFNIPFLRTKLPLAQVEMIPTAKHQLFNEIESIRTPIFERMLRYLQEKQKDPHIPL